MPLNLPSLTRALKLQQRAAKVGFDWDHAAPILDKIEEEIAELRAEISAGQNDKARGEYGDLLFALVNLGRHLKVDPEDSLKSANNKFRRRFRHIEEGLANAGGSLEAASLSEMEALWNDAKENEKSP